MAQCSRTFELSPGEYSDMVAQSERQPVVDIEGGRYRLHRVWVQNVHGRSRAYVTMKPVSPGKPS